MSVQSTEDGISIRTMTQEDFKLYPAFIRKHYVTAEPLTMSSSEDVFESNEQNIGEHNLSYIRQGTSLVAEDSTGRIVGLVMAGAQYPSDLKKNQLEADQLGSGIYGRISRLLSKVELDANIFERYGVTKVLYSNLTCVDASVRGKGLGTRLAAALMDVGRAKGFPLMVAYCTSFYSARQKEAMGMECAHAQLYAEYKNEEGQVVFQISPPHTQVRVMVIRL